MKRPELSCNRADVNLIPGFNKGVREKIPAMPSVGVGGETHVCRYKQSNWASSKKKLRVNE